MPETLRLFAADDAATSAIGAVLAEHLVPGDLVLLDGDLGAGKTALARAIIRAALDDETLDVPSPTFLLVLPYEGNHRTFLHADLYRLSSESELDELGLGDDPEAIVLVEWPDRSPYLSKRADFGIKLNLPPAGSGRGFFIAAPRNPARLASLKKALSTYAV